MKTQRKVWRVLGTEPVAKRAVKTYTASQAERMVRTALHKAGVPAGKIGPTVERLRINRPATVAKSAAAVEAERQARQAELEDNLARRRADSLAKRETRRIAEEHNRARSADPARAAVTFEHRDGSTHSYDSDGPVTRLDLSQPVAKRTTRGIFGEIVNAKPTSPYSG